MKNFKQYLLNQVDDDKEVINELYRLIDLFKNHSILYAQQILNHRGYKFKIEYKRVNSKRNFILLDVTRDSKIPRFATFFYSDTGYLNRVILRFFFSREAQIITLYLRGTLPESR